MAVIFDQTPTYQLLGDGRVLQTGWHRDNGDGILYAGGKIFYIDPDDNGAEYVFYTRTGRIMTDVRVGDEPFAYKVTGTPTKDKYYIFNANAITSKTWTYKNGAGEWVYTLIGTSKDIGAGKTNTASVMAADEGAYVSYTNTIWNSLNALNLASDKGCNDWFVGSEYEIEALRTAVDREGNPLTVLFSNTHIWSSSEFSATDARLWNANNQAWGNHVKGGPRAIVPVRGF